MTSATPLTLLPAFDPLPAVSFTEPPTQTSPTLPAFASSAPPLTPPAAAPAATPTGKSGGGGGGNFFTRARSASLHNSSPVASFFRRDDTEAPPPVPSLPSTPSQTSSARSTRDFTFPSASTSTLAPTPTPIDDAVHPPIKSVTVPHHSKAANGKGWVYACRVVPEPLARPALVSQESSASAEMARRSSLGKMELAGKGAEGAREPHTVWRTWSEFVDFSANLAIAFPVVTPSSPTEVSSASSTNLPSSFYRQGTPRLPRKLNLFVTRATAVQRQTDLDLFVRQLFGMPDQIKRSQIVRDFFRMREEELARLGSPSSPALGGGGTWGDVDEDGPESFSSFLAAANGTTSPNATVRPTPFKRRPGLAVKVSTPNLRNVALTHDFDAEYARPAPMMRAATEDLGAHLRSSNYSVSTSSSASSSVTVTPQSMSTSASTGSLKKPSPLGAAFRFGGGSPERASKATAEPKKRPSLGPLRHFRSLQDLRGSSSHSTPSDAPPVPKIASMSMLRAVTQPHPFPSPSLSPSTASSPVVASNPFPFPPTQSSASSTHSVSPAMGRQRSNSKSSSTSSFEDLWGTGAPYMSPNPSAQSATFRHGPSGRLDRVPETAAQRPRRPSRPSARHTSGSIGTKASCGHSSTPSTSSIGSTRSSAAGSSLDLTRSMSDYRSRRSSTDYSFSDGGSLSTPPTPHSEFGASSKYFVENGQLAQNNKVPPPPFFPVPPSMTAVKMEASQSHDGLPSSPRHSQQSNHSRHSSLEHLRPRTSSTSSRRGQYPLQQSPLDTILASPKFTSAPSLPGTPTSSLYCSSPTPQSPQDRPYLTFKLLHPAANLVLRVPRVNLTLGVLRSLVRDKFATSSCAVQLGGGGGGAGEDAHWGLAYTTPASEVGPCSTQLVITEEDFLGVLERTASLEKVALRIVE